MSRRKVKDTSKNVDLSGREIHCIAVGLSLLRKSVFSRRNQLRDVAEIDALAAKLGSKWYQEEIALDGDIRKFAEKLHNVIQDARERMPKKAAIEADRCAAIILKRVARKD